jgi:ADP-dependent NAD(P)H-hydrate dehydratase / NAD(P)H-hydrate epimerase
MQVSKPGSNSTTTIDRELAASLLPKREFGAHKWGVGGVVIIAGAPGFAGAAILSAMGANRAGAGVVAVASSRSIGGLVVAAVPEVVTVPLPEIDGPMGRKALEALETKIEKSKAVVVGPGLGEDEAADGLLSALFGNTGVKTTIGFGFGSAPPQNSGGETSEGMLSRCDKPLVIDADALNWLAKQESWTALLPKHGAVLTPHVGEMSRLLGKEADEVIADPAATAKEAAAAWGQVVVFKYGNTVVSDGERTLIADDAPLSLATAGTGDVLAGSIGALLAQGMAPLDAAALAVWTGMAAARRVEQRFGTLGVTASDLPVAFAETMAELEHGGDRG